MLEGVDLNHQVGVLNALVLSPQVKAISKCSANDCQVVMACLC
jgi:hypothetical protein